MLDGAHEDSSSCVDDIVLAAFIDGQLPARQRAEVEAHLATCHECSEVSSGAIRAIEQARNRARRDRRVRIAVTVAVLTALAGILLLVFGYFG